MRRLFIALVAPLVGFGLLTSSQAALPALTIPLRLDLTTNSFFLSQMYLLIQPVLNQTVGSLATAPNTLTSLL